MKKAFSLLELVLSVLIFSIIIALLSNPSIQLYDKVFQVKKTNEVFFDLNQILLKIEKIQQDCIEFKYNSHSFECYISASDDIFYDNSLNRMNFSGVILEDNKSFFSPKSNFYIIENAVLKGIFANYKDMHSVRKQKIYPSDFMFVYNLKEQKIHKIFIENNENINFYSDNFSGFYNILYAYIKIYFNNEKIFMQIDNLHGDKKEFLFMQNISKFELDRENNLLKIKICENALNECLSKWIHL
ncbi:hypothetical protein FPD46_02155 [Campylobacter peloridis]|uniref:Prepilin-type N-terminal cleavage/methylation domain-containing protein n=1 Tax=Campylobacter peloridis TaxID=488546 RepID=A0A5C7DZ71_9BACT|nr:hypothetical protein [Campylobacter peloridis]TXE83462.1 hypothetical protein FPD46_02155 [Campylobacter peloridis]